jgi:ubiquinone/menaquinone biosynthesis C-methylase UbiE
MAANYDNAAWFYERLSKLVFGQAQVKAQEYFLNQIKPQSEILIIGGGTGQILESLSRLYPSGLIITYAEISANMISLSRKRKVSQNQVDFITGDIGAINFKQTYDVVITAFLFDNFSGAKLAKVFPLIDAQLKQNGLWLDTDFQLTGPLWQNVMLASMYAFFKLLKAVEVRKLPNVRHTFSQYKYQLNHEKAFYGNFIVSRAYKK